MSGGIITLQGLGFGFFCSTADGRITTNRKMRLTSLSRTTVLESVKRNIQDLVQLVEMSSRMGLSIFRVGSNIVPFASHPCFEERWLEEIEPMLKDVTERIAQSGVRLTMHPGQFVILNSPRQEVTEAALRELRYHFWVLDILGVGPEGRVVIHGGGGYRDKRASCERFLRVITKHSWLRRRLAIENDEKVFSAAETLELAERAGIPMVFDLYHHRLNTSSFDVTRVFKTWNGCVPEFHVSSLPEGEHRFGEHGFWVTLEDVLDLAHMAGGRRADVIVEAKGKEKAIARLLEEARARKLLETVSRVQD